ncbi:MAG: magnesium/cobalt transporter CorA, partial [Dehalococcoidales bacterium]|nr:magnesium/cobalt transporter CorA [Dehalococcoidales bacterium]
MPRIFSRAKRAGLPPGTLTYLGDKKAEKVKISLIDYDETQFQEEEVKTAEECFPFKNTPTVTWINIDGVHDIELIEKLGKHFDLHPLILEDIVNTQQRPKMEDSGNYIFIVLRMLHYDTKDSEVKSEQVRLVLGSNFVISFQESEGDVFEPIRERIRKGKGRIRKMGADYLAYALVDAVVDNYFIVLEKLGEIIEGIEDKLIQAPTPETLQTIHSLKREAISLRKSVWPLRELISGLDRAETPLIHESIKIYIRDIYDHTIQVIDTIESFRDTITGMLDIYLSSVSNRMNEVMKVLTIFAAIFIPLTFIAGVYGMN